MFQLITSLHKHICLSNPLFESQFINWEEVVVVQADVRLGEADLPFSEDGAASESLSPGTYKGKPTHS